MGQDNFCENNNLPIVYAPDGSRGCRYCDYRQVVVVVGCEEDRAQENNSFTAEESKMFSVLPNPSSGLFTVNSFASIGNITITDMLGHTVYCETNIQSNTTNIQLQNVTPGIYLVEINSPGNKPCYSKIVIE